MFSLAEMVGAHHDTSLFRWHLGPAGDGSPMASGYDAVVTAGGLRSVHGFFA